MRWRLMIERREGPAHTHTHTHSACVCSPHSAVKWCKWNNIKGWHLLLHFGLQYVWLPFKSLVIIFRTWLLLSTPFRSHLWKKTKKNRKHSQWRHFSSEHTRVFSSSVFILGWLLDWGGETSFSLFVYVKKKKFCVHVGFLFSVRLIAAVYPFMSNHQCMYPHIPVNPVTHDGP